MSNIKGYMDEALSNVDSVQWGSSEQGHTNTHVQGASARGERGGATAGGPSNIGLFGAKDPNLSAKETYLRREGVGTNRFTGDDPPQNSGGRRGEGKCGGWEKGGWSEFCLANRASNRESRFTWLLFVFFVIATVVVRNGEGGIGN